MLDIEKFVAGLHDYLARALTPVDARLRAIEQKLGIPSPPSTDDDLVAQLRTAMDEQQ